MSTDQPSRLVQRRCVIYFSGFDPNNPSHYHKLYQEQAALAAPLLNAEIQVGPRQPAQKDVLRWTVRATSASASSSTLDGAQEVQTDYLLARWDDIVRQHWLRTNSWLAIWKFANSFLAAHILSIRTGSLFKAARLSKTPCLAHILPLVLALWIGGLLLCGVLLGSAALLQHGFYQAFSPLVGINTAFIAIFLIVIALLSALWVWRLNKRWHMLWLARSFIFTTQQVLGRTPELESRLDSMAQLIAEKLSSGHYDEVLVVGHSSGSMVAALALERALRPAQATKASNTQLSLLTLGHCWPMLNCHLYAQAQRQALAKLCSHEQFYWLDVTSPIDGCCFALIDPLRTLTETPASPYKLRPHLISPRWHTLFNPEQYRALRSDHFRLHFQYLYATPRIGVYDYFAITSGAQSLRDRFKAVPSAV
jgi:pimeloyl-ACP methyl ester carboxylesterase